MILPGFETGTSTISIHSTWAMEIVVIEKGDVKSNKNYGEEAEDVGKVASGSLSLLSSPVEGRHDGMYVVRKVIKRANIQSLNKHKNRKSTPYKI